jgi:catalase
MVQHTAASPEPASDTGRINQDLLQVGEKTALIVRISNVAGELGAVDADRDVRALPLHSTPMTGHWALVATARR